MNINSINEFLHDYDHQKGFWRQVFGDSKPVALLKKFVQRYSNTDAEISFDEFKHFVLRNSYTSLSPYLLKDSLTSIFLRDWSFEQVISEITINLDSIISLPVLNIPPLEVNLIELFLEPLDFFLEHGGDLILRDFICKFNVDFTCDWVGRLTETEFKKAYAEFVYKKSYASRPITFEAYTKTLKAFMKSLPDNYKFDFTYYYSIHLTSKYLLESSRNFSNVMRSLPAALYCTFSTYLPPADFALMRTVAKFLININLPKTAISQLIKAKNDYYRDIFEKNRRDENYINSILIGVFDIEVDFLNGDFVIENVNIIANNIVINASAINVSTEVGIETMGDSFMHANNDDNLIVFDNTQFQIQAMDDVNIFAHSISIYSDNLNTYSGVVNTVENDEIVVLDTLGSVSAPDFSFENIYNSDANWMSGQVVVAYAEEYQPLVRQTVEVPTIYLNRTSSVFWNLPNNPVLLYQADASLNRRRY